MDDEATVRADGWANLLQGFGVRGRDPSMHDRVGPPIERTPQEREWLYRGDPIAARIVDLLPDDATREGWQVKADEMSPERDVTPEEANEIHDGIMAYGRRLEAKDRLRQALSLGRIHGLALMVLGIDDGAGIDGYRLPVREGAVRGVRWLQVIPGHQVTPGPLEDDVSQPGFGKPRSYRVPLGAGTLTDVEVHASRVIRFGGAWSPTTTGSMGGHQCDDGVLDRVFAPLAEFNMGIRSIGRIIRDFSRVRMSIKDFAQKMRGSGIQEIKTRMEGGELAASVLNAWLHDPSESVDFLTRQVAGLPEVFDRLGIYLAACTGMPITQLLGLSPGGLGTGEDEDKRWSNMGKAYQTDRVAPALERLCGAILAAQDGPTQGHVPSAWGVICNPIRSPSAAEVADIRGKICEAYGKLVERQILFPHEVAESMFGRGEWSMDITLDRETRDAMAVAEVIAPGQGEGEDEEPPPDEEMEDEPEDGDDEA